MRIIAFEVREDEVKIFEQLKAEFQMEIVYVREALKEENAYQAAGFEGVTILAGSKLDKVLLNELKNYGVKYISTRSVGYNHIDLKYAKEIGLKISNAAYPPYSVADYTVMLMLMTLRHYKQALFRGNVNDYSLTGLQGREMRSLTVGIIGSGRIGTAVIKNLTGFGCRILVYDKNRSEAAEKMAEYVELDRIYRECDMISLHTPLLDSTYHMINRESIDRMQDQVILINCARGELMSLPDLIQGIESKKIGALGLDVVEQEDGIYHRDLRTDIITNRDMAYLRQFPNVIMTQHMAFYTEEAVESMVRLGVENLVQCINGEDCCFLL